MNYLKKSFTVTGDLAGVSAYRKNWERVFGNPERKVIILKPRSLGASTLFASLFSSEPTPTRSRKARRNP